MALNDEQLNKNSLLFISLRANISIDEKLESVIWCIEQGADVNATDGNDNDNSPLHVAARRGEKAIAQLLVQKGANITTKNCIEETPLDLARHANHNDIICLLETGEESARDHALSNKNRLQTLHNDLENNVENEYKFSKRPGTSGVRGHLYETKLLCLVFLRALKDQQIKDFLLGTNIDGVGDMDDICLRYQVKGRKTPVMLFLQAKHRENTEKGKLTSEEVRHVSGDFSLPKYYDSYHTIKSRFIYGSKNPTIKKEQKRVTESKNEENILQEEKDNQKIISDPMFQGNFDKVEPYFIIYTSAQVNDCFFKNNPNNASKINKKVNYLISTRQNVEAFQIDDEESTIDILTNLINFERIKRLGITFLNIIMSGDSKPDVLSIELIARYHVLLKWKVVKKIENQPNNKNYCLWMFRPEFFESKCKYLIAIKQAIMTEMSTKRCDRSDISKEDGTNFQNFVKDPCVATLSKLIGRLILYNNKDKKLKFIEVSALTDMFKENDLKEMLTQFNKIQMKEDDVIEAIITNLLAKKIKLDISFGNLDMAFSVNGKKRIRRINYLTTNLINILKNHKDDKNVHIIIDDEQNDPKESTNLGTKSINNSIKSAMTISNFYDEFGKPGKIIEQGFMKNNGGIGGALGNLLILDTKTNMLKFNLDQEELPYYAALFLNKLKDDKLVGKDLHKFRIKVCCDKFPKYSFDEDDNDKKQVRDFLKKFWVYANQEKENRVEAIVKEELNKHYNNNKDLNKIEFKIRSDAIFLIFHDNIQKWWMGQYKSTYLNKHSKLIEHAKHALLLENPLLTSLNLLCTQETRIQSVDIQFEQDAAVSLDLSRTTRTKKLINVITESSVLTCIKIRKQLKNEDGYLFINFDHVLDLTLEVYNIMLQELRQTKIETIIITNIKKKHVDCVSTNKLKEVFLKFNGRNIVVITDTRLNVKNVEHFNENCQLVRDDKTHLIHLTESSQMNILDKSTIVFQGEEWPLKSIMYESAQNIVRTAILMKLINSEKIEIGLSVVDQICKQIKHTGNPVRLTEQHVNSKRMSPLPWIVWQPESTEFVTKPIDMHSVSKRALKHYDQLQIQGNQHTSNIDEDNVSQQEDINSMALFEWELFQYLNNCNQVIFFEHNYEI